MRTSSEIGYKPFKSSARRRSPFSHFSASWVSVDRYVVASSPLLVPCSRPTVSILLYERFFMALVRNVTEALVASLAILDGNFGG